MTLRHALSTWLAFAGVGLAFACREPAVLGEPPSSWRPRHDLTPPPIRAISARDLCVTSGRLHPTGDARWVNARPSFRAVAPRSTGHHATLAFRYLGLTEREKRLASGLTRRQVGLKLLSRDSCNVVYAMWRFDEPASVVASVKANPDFARHAVCGNRGYRNLRPVWKAPVEAPQVGSTHELSATLQQGLLEVSIDRRLVLRAWVDGSRTPRFGASGVRSDNVRFELLRFEADVPESSWATAAGCRS